MVFDNQCILWAETCDGKGSCLEYNIEQLPFVFFGVCLSIKCLSYVFIVLTYIMAKRGEKLKTKAAPSSSGHMGYDNQGTLELDTPQSDVTVSTICSSYATYDQSTRL